MMSHSLHSFLKVIRRQRHLVVVGISPYELSNNHIKKAYLAYQASKWYVQNGHADRMAIKSE